MGNVSAFDMISPTAKQLMMELVGDRTAFLQVITYHDFIINKREAEAMIKVLKEESVTTKGLRLMFELDSDDADFCAFHDLVDDMCKDSLDACYGRFAELTTPIISQTQITIMVNEFKTKLWKYYALFMTLLNKSRYVNVTARNESLHQWDRLALLLFISVMRMRNKRCFTWMGVINAAAYWTSSGGNMSVLFGQKVTRDSMVRKLTKLVSPEECERRTIATLSVQKFVKGSWDNTQRYQQTKFQCGKSSGQMQLATMTFSMSQVPMMIQYLKNPKLRLSFKSSLGSSISKTMSPSQTLPQSSKIPNSTQLITDSKEATLKRRHKRIPLPNPS